MDSKLCNAYLSVLDPPPASDDQSRDEHADYVPMQSDVRMIGVVMPIWGSFQAIMKLSPGKFIRDFRAAKDVLTSKNDRGPLFYIPLTMAELGFKAIKKFQSLQAASTEDMEWNGEQLIKELE